MGGLGVTGRQVSAARQQARWWISSLQGVIAGEFHTDQDRLGIELGVGAIVGAAGHHFAVGWKQDPVEFAVAAEEVGARGAAEDLGCVVVARDQSVVIDVEILHPTVGVDFGRERDPQAAPDLTRPFLPGSEFLDVEAGSGRQERQVDVVPQRVAAEIQSLQVIPRRRQGLPVERSSRVDAILQHSAVR
jgi:hypothetical protein